MTCGEPGALVGMLKEPLAAPATVGVKVKLIEQLPIGMSPVQLFVDIANGPEMVGPRMLITADPVLVMVSVWAPLVVETVCAAKLNEVALGLKIGAGAAVTVSVALLVLVLFPARVLRSPAAILTK